MKDQAKTKQMLIGELASLRERVAALEKSELELKQAEEALRENEEKYRTLFENAGEAIFVAQDAKLVFVNPTTVTITGYSGEELASSPFTDFIHVDDRDMVRDRYVKRLKGENIPPRYSFRVLHKKGGFRWVELDAVIINWKGRPASLNFVSDITERKRAEEKEKETHALLRIAGEKAKLGGWSANLEENLVIWSDEVAAIHEMPAGYSPSVEKGISFYPPEWQERITKVFTDCAQKGIPYDEEMEIITAGGKRVWVRTIGEALKNDAGKILKVQGAFQDITDRKRAEEALRERESFLQKIFDIIPVGLWFVDKNGKLLRGNPAGVKIWGAEPKVNPSEYGVFKARRLPSGEEIAPGDWALAHTIREGVTVVDEMLEIDAFDGKKKVILNYTSPVLDDRGALQGAIVVNLDITERKEAEDKIKKQTDAMEAAIEGMALLNKDEEYTYMNQAHARIYGYENAGELIGKSWRILYDADEIQRFDAEIMPKFGQTGYWQGEALGMKKNGSKFPQEISLTALEGGGLICVVHDITERKRAEAELVESKALIEAVVENVPLMIFLKESTDLRFVIFNRAGEELLGHDRRDLIGKNNLDLFPPEQAANFMAKDREVLDGEAGMLDIPEEPILTAKKGERLLHTRKVRIHGFDGATKFLLGISEDITERKRAEEELRGTLESLRKAVGTTIQVMVSAVEARDPYTAGHQLRSADLARAIAAQMGLPQEKIEGLRMVGSIHDIGKLSIPAEILSKPSKLTNIEFSLTKEHARMGYEMLKDVESPWPLAEIVYQHHERMDGSGYPRNLKGDEILIEARILAVADVVEAMASHRPYRPTLGTDAALEEIEINQGTLYDADAVDACLTLFREKMYHLS